MDARLAEVGRYTSAMYLDSHIHKAIIKHTLLLKIYTHVSHIAVIVMYGLILLTYFWTTQLELGKSYDNPGTNQPTVEDIHVETKWIN